MPASDLPLSRLIAEAAQTLRNAGIENPAQEARWLAAHAAGTTLSGLLAGATPNPATLGALVARRAAHEPLAYLLGTAPFRGLDLEVAPATLIPRPCSETLIEAALHHRPDRASVHSILDLGTGTGCLLLAALAEYPSAWGLGIDRVPAAAALAARNAARAGLAPRAAFAAANWAAPLAARFDLLLANPPYIQSADIPALMPEVAFHEPATALDGGPDGLDAYRALMPALPGLLSPGGIAIFETGAGMAAPVASLAPQAWPVAHRADHAGHIRALIVGPIPAGCKKPVGGAPTQG